MTSLSGIPSVDSLTTDKVYDNFFKDAKNYSAFHTGFIQLCSEFNTIMPGKHYILNARIDDIKKLYDEWAKKDKTDEQKKELVVNFLKDNIEEYKPSSAAMIATGLVAPGAAVALKKSAQKVPQLKLLRLDLVPNAVFVPTATLLSLIAVRMLDLRKAPAKLAKKT
ncbi:uncharacterized protein LOC141840815 isoform X2 [Curcuma longa]|uniref:uncharacterized protein LOC141840815 isoform X2 n=1 Tax=Curcuma longa TaxID=136217 RepID=UPI003D9E6BC7